MTLIRSKDNPKLRRWRRLVRDADARREARRAMIEGPHLIDTWLRHGGEIACLVMGESAQHDSEVAALVALSGATTFVIADAVMRALSDVRTPQGIAAEVPIPLHASPLVGCPSCIFLDGVQDAGNVGAILRSAAAFGIPDIVLGPGCADPWSPKVLRAASGAHVALRLREADRLGNAIRAFGGRVYSTTPRGGTSLDKAELAGRIGWILGSEGQGVAPEIAELAAGAVSIPLSAAAESLNVAAAAAILFHETARRRVPLSA